MSVVIHPGRPLTIALSFRSPHLVAYRLRVRWPGSGWEVFALGTERDDGLPLRLEALPPGSRIGYRFLYTSEREVPFQAALRILQDGEPCAGGEVRIEGERSGAGGVEGELGVVAIGAREAS